MPLGQGFDSSFGHMGGCIDNYSHFSTGKARTVTTCGATARRFTSGPLLPRPHGRGGRRFLEAHRDRPFFLYFALNLPHYPYQGEPELLQRFAALPYPAEPLRGVRLHARRADRPAREEVDELGLREQTIILFQSDNGHSTEERAHGGGARGAYRGAKFSLFEGGIRLPAMISWPGRLPGGRRARPARPRLRLAAHDRRALRREARRTRTSTARASCG